MTAGIFAIYAGISIGSALYLVASALGTKQNYFDTVMLICSSKLNLALLFNFVLAVCLSSAKILIYVFFG